MILKGVFYLFGHNKVSILNIPRASGHAENIHVGLLWEGNILQCPGLHGSRLKALTHS